MIQFDHVDKFYSGKAGRVVVLKNACFSIPKDKNCLVMGAQGSGKTTLLNLIGKIDFPNMGKVLHQLDVSWPLNVIRFQPGMTIGQNMRFLARITGHVDPYDYVESVQQFLFEPIELKRNFDALTGPERREISFAITACLPFETIICEQIIQFSDHEKKHHYLEKINGLTKEKQIIMASNNPGQLIELFDMAIKIDHGDVEVTHSNDEIKEWITGLK